MKAYTIDCPGRISDGIELVGGRIDVGARMGGGEPVTIRPDARATVVDGRLVEAPGRGALLFIRDQAGAFGSWHLRDAQPDERWDAMAAADGIHNGLERILAMGRVRDKFPHRAPAAWQEFARGNLPPKEGVKSERLLVNIYGYLQEGGAFEIRRRGRLDGTASVYRVECRDGSVCVTDPRVAALARSRARAPS